MAKHACSISYGSRARIGVILPSGNRAAEPQFARMTPSGVTLHVTRLGLTGTSEEDLLAMTRDVESAAQLLNDVDPALILFHCTAVSTYSMELEASIIQRIRDASGRNATATSQAITAALRALKAKRIVMLSPYPDPIHMKEIQFLQASGFEVVGEARIPCPSVTHMMAVTPEQWQELVLENRHADADAYLLSCTAVRTAEVVHTLESVLERPVITSNTCAMWHCLRTLGIDDAVDGFGRLFSL